MGVGESWFGVAEFSACGRRQVDVRRHRRESRSDVDPSALRGGVGEFREEIAVDGDGKDVARGFVVVHGKRVAKKVVASKKEEVV